MGGKQSSPRVRNSDGYYHYSSATSSILPQDQNTLDDSSQLNNRPRARSLFSNLNDTNFDDLSFPSSSNNNLSSLTSPSFLNNSDDNSPINSLLSTRFLALTQSLPSSFFTFEDLKCPICTRKLPSDDIEYHLILCLTKPRINYNGETLKDDKGECTICLEDMSIGHDIARLPCLCIYHKECIDKWFTKSRSCPEHPVD
ncbi:unnamed protein product [Gordionus sp. m RMFG-2023]|uniref:E3 ubiquitin-protein ligase znrf2-like n=1 Tax=Gordionus sp. m RMFG-2023 TaxID=3053472 RepID=UPI0030E29080